VIANMPTENGEFSIFPLKFSLMLIYLFTLIFVTSQISRIIYYKHNFKNFQFGFLILTFFWMLLRVIYFLPQIITHLSEWPDWLECIIVYFPVIFEFATFSLLVIFFAHLIHKEKWDKRFKIRFYIGYIVINSILIIFVIVICILRSINTEVSRERDYVQLAFFTFVFFLLVFILSAYTYKLYQLSKYNDRILVQPNVITTKKLVYLSTIITLLLASRCIYDILVLSDSNTRTKIKTDKDLPYIAFLFFFIYFVGNVTNKFNPICISPNSKN